MQKLTISRNSPAMYALQNRLEQAGFKTAITTDLAETQISIGASPPLILWIEDDGNLPAAIEMARQIESEQTESKCPACGYDLSGHSGQTKCPECGRAISVAGPDVTCPNCQEAVPDNFEVCWNCGADLK